MGNNIQTDRVRPSYYIIGGALLYCLCFCLIVSSIATKRTAGEKSLNEACSIADNLGFYDLCLSTEARYTRHPMVSDKMTVVMDHPGAIDHFPSTLFWAPLP